MNSINLVEAAAKLIDRLDDPQTLANDAFLPFDDGIQSSDDATKRQCFELLKTAEEKIRQSDSEKKNWWLSEICLRKARCARGIIDRKREYSYWKDARNYAVEAGNHEVCLQSSLELGFTFVEFTSSLREILEIQMSCVKAICAGDVATTSRLRIIGVNLFDFWRQLEYRRLSEHDLKAKQFIIDSAKSLERAGFDDDSAAPVMILLISKVFDFDAPALEWAKMETTVLYIPVPEDIKQKLGDLL